MRPVCRSGQIQHAIYNVHEKVPSFKPRSVATPNDGMMANLCGSVEGEGTRAIWDKVFKNGPKKICKRQSLKNFTWSILECSVPYVSTI